MQANNRTDAGCTVDAVPYKVLDLEASKLNFAGPDVKATPVMAVPLVLENAPVGVVPFVFPTGWNVPVMFGPNITGEFVASAYVPVGTQNGAFRVGPIKDCPNKDNNGGHLFYFDASDSDSTYGATQTVQPPSIRLVQCIKF